MRKQNFLTNLFFTGLFLAGACFWPGDAFAQGRTQFPTYESRTYNSFNAFQENLFRSVENSYVDSVKKRFSVHESVERFSVSYPEWGDRTYFFLAGTWFWYEGSFAQYRKQFPTYDSRIHGSFEAFIKSIEDRYIESVRRFHVHEYPKGEVRVPGYARRASGPRMVLAYPEREGRRETFGMTDFHSPMATGKSSQPASRHAGGYSPNWRHFRP